MRNISLLYASIIFTVFTAYFFALLFTIYPFLSGHLNWNPVLNWFVTGYFLFIPMLIYAVIAAKWEGRTTLTAIFSGLSIKPMSARDWKCAASGLAVVFA
ncbi:MAG: hypothetical protein Q8J78_16445, partial [Moraxellaceae bacterium]|nr:hypothetical protein [Moraxellaceae bacterium]